MLLCRFNRCRNMICLLGNCLNKFIEEIKLKTKRNIYGFHVMTVLKQREAEPLSQNNNN